MAPRVSLQPVFDQRLMPPVFNEGALGTIKKVVTFSIALLASLFTFFLMPFGGAVFATLGSLLLASCVTRGGDSRPDQSHERQECRQGAPDSMRRFSVNVNVQPVRQQGPRVQVETGSQMRERVVQERPVANHLFPAQQRGAVFSVESAPQHMDNSQFGRIRPAAHRERANVTTAHPPPPQRKRQPIPQQHVPVGRG